MTTKQHNVWLGYGQEYKTQRVTTESHQFRNELIELNQKLRQFFPDLHWESVVLQSGPLPVQGVGSTHASVVRKYLSQREGVEGAVVCVLRNVAKSNEIDSTLRELGFPLTDRVACAAADDEDGPDRDRHLIELCCEENSSLSQPVGSAKGCHVVKVTKTQDLIKPSTHIYIRSVMARNNGAIWFSCPCTGGSSWQHINKSNGDKLGTC